MTGETNFLLELTHVGKRYDAPDAAAGPEVLRDVSLRVRPGESVAVVGPSGSGKSTLLNIIGTLDRPTSGTVTLDGMNPAELNDEQLAAFRSRRIGFVFQLHHLLPQCTVLENVLIPTLAPGAPRADEAETRARELLERVGLADRLDYRPGRLSGGECQRVAVVRALIHSPALLLADEPTGSLDRATSAALGDLLVELNRERGVTLIVVTHSLRLARRMARLMELRDGSLSDWKGGA